MEQNGEGLAKKIWHMVRVAFFMLKKGISKRRILLDLNIMMKRGKLAGKSIRNLMSHHHHHHHRDTVDTGGSNEYEFSCSNTPLYHHYFSKKKSLNSQQLDMDTVNKVLDMVMSSSPNVGIEGSPSLPGLGFGRSPMTRQLRITDSPYPIGENSPGEESRVDQAAEDFINKFYSQLKQQKYY